jgi:hypothetical protein
VSVADLNLLEWPTLRIERAGNGLCRSWASAPAATNDVPAGQRYYFGRASHLCATIMPSDLISGSVRSMIGPAKGLHHMPAKAVSFEPMVCDKAEQPPEGPEWRYELKLDGYRTIAFKTDGQAWLWSRNRKDFVRRFHFTHPARNQSPVIVLGVD